MKTKTIVVRGIGILLAVSTVALVLYEVFFESVPFGHPVKPSAAYVAVFKAIRPAPVPSKDVLALILLQLPSSERIAGPPTCKQGQVIAFMTSSSRAIMPSVEVEEMYVRIWIQLDASDGMHPQVLDIAWNGLPSVRASLLPNALPNLTSNATMDLYCNKWVSKPLWQLKSVLGDFSHGDPTLVKLDNTVFPIEWASNKIVGWKRNHEGLPTLTVATN